MIKKYLNIFSYIIVCIFLCSCTKGSSQTTNKVVSSKIKSDTYETVGLTSTISKEDDQIVVHQLKNNLVPLVLYTFKGGNSFLEVNDHIIQFPIAFDFIRSENLDTTKEILLFKQNNKYYILFPAFSEGFTTFTLLEFSQDGTYKYLGDHTYNNDIFNKIKNTPPEKRIYFLKHGKTKTPGIFVKQGNNDLLFSEISYPEPTPLPNEEIEKINFYKKGGSSRNLKTSPSDLTGMWGVNCQNELTVLKINKNEGFLSLYDFNAIYINLKVEKSSNKNEYLLKYANVSSQENYYDDHLKITDEEISKDKVIGKLIVQNNGKAELKWIGLYNMKKQKLEFVGNDFLLIKENGGKTPLILERCH